MATSPQVSMKESSYDPDDVLFNAIYGVRTIELNRPEKLNSLNGSMARKILSRLKVHIPQSLPPSLVPLNDCSV